MQLKRRSFLQTTLASGLLAACPAAVSASSATDRTPADFKLASHLGQFRNLAGTDWKGQLDFIAAQGFRGIQENGLANRSLSFLHALRHELESRNLELGPFVGVAEYARAMFHTPERDGQRRLERMHIAALQVARTSGATSCIIVPGKRDMTTKHERQLSEAARFYRQLADRFDKVGTTLVIEPVHHAATNSPMLLSSLDEAIDLCERISHPRVRLLFDVYQQHQQLDDFEAGLDRAAPWLGHVELGDSHGRKEPGTGDIDFGRLFASLRRYNYSGLIGLEHGTSKPGKLGERSVLAAYQQLGLITAQSDIA